MRSARHPGPPSTVSGSSRHGLVYGTHRPRGPPVAFTPEGSDTPPAKKKTKLIVILGIALPVLACIIGIAAWAVTTDVLRITPRAGDNSYNRFGHQGKTRIGNMQSRSDTDVDVFVLHGITSPTLPSPTTQTKSSKKTSTMSSASTNGETASSTIQSMTSPTASDILSKLISDMPVPKPPKNFIVFAPVADTENAEKERKGRRFDDKIVVHDGDDLIAEESIVSEDTSQELSLDKLPFKRNRKPPPAESMYSIKPGMRPSQYKKSNENGKLNRNPRLLPPDSFSENSPDYFKRPHRGEYVTFPTSSKPPMNAISNRKGGITQPRPSDNFPQRTVYPSNLHQNKKGGFQNFDKMKMESDHKILQNQQNFESEKIRNNHNPSLQSPAFQPSTPPKYHHISHSFPQQETFSSPPQNQFSMQDNQLSNQYTNDNQRPLQGQKQSLSNYNQQNSGPIMNQHHSGLNMNQANSGSNINQQYTGYNVNHQNTGSNFNQQSLQSNFQNLPHNFHSSDSSPMGNGGAQYFAPPPQTFHTKINYDNPPPKAPLPSMSTYEKVAQSSVDPTDGMHHHHHHHHHHEPVASNSDPIGDVNYSDVPRVNDADRLGTIGIGMGPSRGITLQIGGGGGGLGGLLPLGTLGIARNVLSALLPRPQLGLNSKVFLGVEVGRGGGLSLG